MEVKLGGHLPDPEEGRERDFSFEAKLEPFLGAGSGDADLRPFASLRHSQRSTGSCVAQAVVKSLENLERQRKCRQLGISPSQLTLDQHTDLSVLALYYLCREQMVPSMINEDKGTFIHLACKCLQKFGVCSEKVWPFNESKLFVAPSLMAMREAFLHKITAYYRVTKGGQDRISSVIDALRGNFPVVFGTIVGDNWAGYQNFRPGMVLGVPNPIDPTRGHATHLVGWDQRWLFIGENSWGNAWGDDGFYYLAPEVIANPISRDFWVIGISQEVRQ